MCRTETVQDDFNHNWATTFSFDYDAALNAASTIVVDIFGRDSRYSSYLSKHDLLGWEFFRLEDLADSPHMRLDKKTGAHASVHDISAQSSETGLHVLLSHVA